MAASWPAGAKKVTPNGVPSPPSDTGTASTSIIPDSIFDRSRTSLISLSRDLPLLLINEACFACSSLSGPLISFARMSDSANTALSGVLSSCDMLARN